MTTTQSGVDATQTLASLVAEAAQRSTVFERLGLDYCCHGQRSLADACAAAGVDVERVAAELAAIAPVELGPVPVEPSALADHIEARHHGYLHSELPGLSALSAKVAAAHGHRHPELARVHELVTELRAELEPHLAREERVLFPAIRALDRGQRGFPFGTVRNPVRMMMIEHDRAGELLGDLRAATSGYAAPADACASYRALYGRLRHLEADTHLHIHLENNVLFPAAIALEGARP
jgi:regulator of cell morphogenesis and NO signaling